MEGGDQADQHVGDDVHARSMTGCAGVRVTRVRLYRGPRGSDRAA